MARWAPLFIAVVACSRPAPSPAPLPMARPAGLPPGAACATDKRECGAGLHCTGDAQADGQCPAVGRCEPLPDAPALELSLPFPAGDVVYCAKGNLHPASTHNACNGSCRFDFDFASGAAAPPRLVLASADGVAYPFGGCASEDLNAPVKDTQCNAEWGNFIRVQHGTSGYTLYAHLSALLVNWGQKVRRGEVVGIEGNTGAAGAKHLHWGLHEGHALDSGRSIPIRRLRTAGGVVEGPSVQCGDFTRNPEPAANTRVMSDNVPLESAPRFRFVPSMEGAWADARSSDSATRRRFIALFEAYATGLPEARYWRGVALSLEGRDGEAWQLWQPLSEEVKAPLPLRRWSALRLAELAIADGRSTEARRLLEVLQRLPEGSDPELLERVRAAAERVAVKRRAR